MGKARVRPAHVLRMCNRLSKKFPELDFTNIVTIDSDALQTRFENDRLAGCFSCTTDSIHIGLPVWEIDFFAHITYEEVASTLLHEVIHRYVYKTHGDAKGHGLEFQEACLKFGLDPRKEIKHDKTAELMVEVPYAPTVFMSGGGLMLDDYQDFYEKEDVSDEVYLASRSIYRRGKRSYYDEEEFLDYAHDVYMHKYYQHYPSYRLCKHIVSNYFVPRDTKLRDLQEKIIREAKEAA